MHPELVAPPTVTPLPRVLRVATFNVEYVTRAETLAAVFRSHDQLRRADLLLLQEMESHPWEGGSRAALLAAALGMGHAYMPSRRSGEHGSHGQAILSRWPLRELAAIELPFFRLPFNHRQCIAMTAQVDTPAGSLRLTSVHLDTRINLATRIRQLTPAIAAEPALQILAGDMNTLPLHFVGGAVPVFPVDQAGRLDAHMRRLGFATPASGAGPTHRHALPVRLDAIFTRGLTPAPAQVARDVRISDHYPVWVDVELPAAR